MVIRKYIVSACLSILVFCVYLHNLSQGIYGGDVGDLVTASFVGGVAHPPGYPLFTFLGFLLTRFSFFPTPAFAVGLISVTAGTLGVLFFYLTVKELVKSTLISMISACILAFSYFFWFYSEIAEVFILNALFFILLFYLAVKIAKGKKYSLFPVFFFFLGLSLTNHQTIVLTFPSLFLLFLPIIRKWFEKRKFSSSFILKSILAFCLGLIVYVYVPIASTHHPVINWDTVHDIPSFFHLILRKDYGTFSGGIYASSSFLQRLVLIKIYLTQVAIQLTLPTIFICCVGLLYTIRKEKILTVSLLGGFLLSGSLFIAYAGFPLSGNFYFGVNERFFILSIVFILYFFPYGLVLLTKLFQRMSHVSPLLFQLVFFIIPLMLFIYNFPKTNLSSVFIGDNYAKDILVGLPKNSILFLNGDTTIFNTWYIEYVEGFHRDVHLLNINGDIGSPYYDVLKTNYLSKHPHASPQQIVMGVTSQLPEDGSVFSVQALVTNNHTFAWIPYGLEFQLLDKNHLPSEEMFTKKTQKNWSQFHIPASSNSLVLGNVTIADIPNSYANAMLVTGNFYFSQYHDMSEAKIWYDKAQKTVPNYDKTYSSLAVWYLTQKNCSASIENSEKARSINPIEPINYLLEYTTYKSCLHDKVKSDNIAHAFEKQFQIPFAKAIKSLDNIK